MIKLYLFLYVLGKSINKTVAKEPIYQNEVVVEFHLPETVTNEFIRHFESKHELVHQGTGY